VIENNHNRRFDIVLFVNGIPLVVIELKNPADENATIWTAFNQLETYKDQIPSIFRFNEILVISDGMEAWAGTITADNESAVEVLGNETLKDIAEELVDTLKHNVTIDWILKESIQAKLRLLVKKTLKKYGYPPDKQAKATDLVLEQASLLCKDWAEISN
jgi:type I site-specific restriction-modification system R (restriction) subunit